MSERVLVIGGTRGTGLLVAKRLLANRYRVRVLARDTARARARFGSDVDVVAGDITKPATLGPALDGVDHVIFTAAAPKRPATEATIRTTDYQGVRNTLDAAATAGFRGRFLYMSSIGVATPSLVATLLNAIKRNALVWRKRAEDDVRGSELAYTIIRAAFLVNAAGGRKAIEVGQSNLPLRVSYRIAREDVADAFVAALTHARTLRTTFEIRWTAGSSREPWPALLDRLSPDR